MEKTKSCFTCEKLIGTNGEICPVLAERFVKVFGRVAESPFLILPEILKVNGGCLEHQECADRKEQKAKNDIYAEKVADMFGDFLESQGSGVLPKMAAPMVNIKNLTVNIRCINK